MTVDAETVFQQGMRYQFENKKEEAYIAFKKTVKLNKRHAYAWANIGLYLLEKGCVTEAVKATKNFIALEPHNLKGYINLGLMFKEQKELGRAIRTFTKILEHYPEHSDANTNLAALSNEVGNLGKAIKYSQKAIKLNPYNPICYKNLADVYRKKEKISAASRSIQTAIFIDPLTPGLHVSKAHILLESNLLENAERSARNAIRLKSDLPTAYLILGLIKFEEGDLDESINVLKRAIELDPCLVEAVVNLGIIYSYKGLNSKSNYLLGRAINLAYLQVDLLVNIKVWQAINYFLLGDLCLANETIIESSIILKKKDGIAYRDKRSKKHNLGYISFLLKLIPLTSNNKPLPETRNIHHIGDSHCLSFAFKNLTINDQTYNIKPLLVQGVKAWHLASNKPNRFQSSFLGQIKGLDDSSPLFVSIGEIDCRDDEGILLHSRKYNKNSENVCLETTSGFIKFLANKVSKSAKNIYILGTPAPVINNNISMLSSNEKDRIKLVRIFNNQLKEQCYTYNFNFIDVYEYTKDSNGVNNNRHLCDGIHLNPDSLFDLFNFHEA